MVGIQAFPIGEAYFQGRTVSFREGNSPGGDEPASWAGGCPRRHTSGERSPATTPVGFYIPIKGGMSLSPI